MSDPKEDTSTIQMELKNFETDSKMMDTELRMTD